MLPCHENGAGSLHWFVVEGQKITDLGLKKKKMFRHDAGFFLRAVKQDAQTGCAVSVLGSLESQTKPDKTLHGTVWP